MNGPMMARMGCGPSVLEVLSASFSLRSVIVIEATRPGGIVLHMDISSVLFASMSSSLYVMFSVREGCRR